MVATMTKITVIGLGDVGLANAVMLAESCRVTAVDIDEARLRAISAGVSPIGDEEIQSRLSAGGLCLAVSGDTAASCVGADYILVSVPTDSASAGIAGFDTSAVEAVVDTAYRAAPDSVIVLRSTIPAGFTQRLLAAHPGIRLLYVPEFSREGKALYDNLHPTRLVVGIPPEREELRPAARALAGELLRHAEERDVPVLYMGAAEAEAVKLFANTYLAMRISFFNELDTYAQVNGLSTGDIIDGMCYDGRIGDYYNNPSFGYGGNCLPKDVKQLLLNFSAVPNILIRSVVESNRVRKRFTAERILAEAAARPDGDRPVGVYRLTMKKDADNFRQSAVCDIILALLEQGREVLVYEPAAPEDTYLGAPVTRDLAEFKARTGLIVANRYDRELSDVVERVYTRDLYSRD